MMGKEKLAAYLLKTFSDITVNNSRRYGYFHYEVGTPGQKEAIQKIYAQYSSQYAAIEALVNDGTIRKTKEIHEQLWQLHNNADHALRSIEQDIVQDACSRVLTENKGKMDNWYRSGEVSPAAKQAYQQYNDHIVEQQSRIADGKVGYYQGFKDDEDRLYKETKKKIRDTSSMILTKESNMQIKKSSIFNFRTKAMLELIASILLDGNPVGRKAYDDFIKKCVDEEKNVQKSTESFAQLEQRLENAYAETKQQIEESAKERNRMLTQYLDTQLASINGLLDPAKQFRGSTAKNAAMMKLKEDVDAIKKDIDAAQITNTDQINRRLKDPNLAFQQHIDVAIDESKKAKRFFGQSNVATQLEKFRPQRLYSSTSVESIKQPAQVSQPKTLNQIFLPISKLVADQRWASMRLNADASDKETNLVNAIMDLQRSIIRYRTKGIEFNDAWLTDYNHIAKELKDPLDKAISAATAMASQNASQNRFINKSNNIGHEVLDELKPFQAMLQQKAPTVMGTPTVSQSPSKPQARG
jgi:hypothetical protein